jgi:hypothetical protein
MIEVYFSMLETIDKHDDLQVLSKMTQKEKDTFKIQFL